MGACWAARGYQALKPASVSAGYRDGSECRCRLPDCIAVPYAIIVVGSRVLFDREIWTATAVVGHDPLVRDRGDSSVYPLERDSRGVTSPSGKLVVAYSRSSFADRVVPQLPQLAPRPERRLLHGVLGLARVPQDHQREPV